MAEDEVSKYTFFNPTGKTVRTETPPNFQYSIDSNYTNFVTWGKYDTEHKEALEDADEDDNNNDPNIAFKRSTI